MNQSELLAITFNFLKARKNLAYKVRLGLALLVIGWKTDRANHLS